MRQAIVTKYLGPTNFKGSRIKASASAGSIVVNWDHDRDTDENYRAAAMALVKKFEWDKLTYKTKWVGGCLPCGSYCFVDAKGDDNAKI